MMLNFLDLSAASEEERRLITEILSDTSDVNTITTSQPTNFSNNNSNSNNGHANNNNNTFSSTTPAAPTLSPTTATASTTTTTTIATSNNNNNNTNQFTTSNHNHSPNLASQQNHRNSNNQYNSVNSSQQRKNIHSSNSIGSSNNNRNRNNNNRPNQVAGGSNNVQQHLQQQHHQQQQLYYPQQYTPPLPSNISSSPSSHYHNNINSASSASSGCSNNINNVNSLNNHSANALNSQRTSNNINNEDSNDRLRSNISNHTLQNNNDNNIVVTSSNSNHLVQTQTPSMDHQHLQHQHHHHHAQHHHANNAMPLNVYNHHTAPMHHHQVSHPVIPTNPISSGTTSSTAKLDTKNNSSNNLKNPAYQNPQDTSNANLQVNNSTNNSITGAQSVPPSAQMQQPMPGDMNSVIGMDMTSAQPPSYAMPPHVTAFGPPPHHVYGGTPIFQPYHYLIHPYNLPASYMPYMLAPNSVVPPRQQVPPQSSQPPSTSTTTSSHSRTHSRSHLSHHHHQQQQHLQQQPNHDYSNITNQNNQEQVACQEDVGTLTPATPATVNQGPILKKSISDKDPIEGPKVVNKTTSVNSQNDNRSSSQRYEKMKKPNVETEASPEVENTTDNKSTIQEYGAVSFEKSSKVSPNLKTSNISNVKPNNVIKGGSSIVTKNKNVVPSARTDKKENQMHMVESDANSAASLLTNRNVPLERTKDETKHQDVQVPLASTNGDEMVKLSSDEGFDTQSSLDISKRSHESSMPNTDESKSSPENCNKSMLEKREMAESNDIKSSDATQRSGGAWGSASSKSWASLFKSGGGPLHDSSLNGETDHNNISDLENSDEENKMSRSLSNKLSETSVKVNNLVSSSKEQRSQEAAKRALDKVAPRLAQKINSINLKHSLPFLKPRGFINKGNGCYINATLQALIACPPFYNLMKEIGVSRRENSCTPILDSFAELFLNFPPLDTGKKDKQTSNIQDQKLNINYLQAEAIEPKCIYNVLGQIKSECLKGAQEDAEEFLSSVLNCLHEEIIGLSEILQSMQDSNTPNGPQSDVDDSTDDIANDDNLWREVGPKNRSLPIRTAKVIKTPIQEIFGGSLFSIRTAGKDRCGHRSPFFDLQLDISSDNVRSVQDAIKSFTAPEVIHDFYCSKTKQKLDAQRRTSLDQLPPILILHLKQFVYTQDHGLKKLIKKIEYPIDFELPENCLHEKNSADKNFRTRSYKLLAVVYHDGKEAIKGHYLTDVYHIGSSQWIRCDDSNLKVIPSPRIENPDSSRTPYLLFYRRLNTLRAQTGNRDNKKKS